MTHDDEDEPTNPGVGGPIVSVPPLRASAAAADDDRPTVPAPKPERLDPTPRKAVKPPPLPQIERALEAFDAAPEVDLEDRATDPKIVFEAETVRPPPPEAKEREEAMAAVMAVASTKPSSIAPREVVRKTAPPPPSRKSSGAMIALGMLALLGAGVIYRQNAMSSRGAASSPAPQTAPQEHVAIAPRGPQGEAEAEAVQDSTTATTTTTTTAATTQGVREVEAGEADASRGRVPRAPRKAKATVVPAELPEQPSRKVIGDAIGALRSDFAACAAGKTGVAELDLTINGNGSVSHALVGGDFAGSPQGSCIARTVRRAHVAPFQQAKFRVLYRLAL